jgi:hypothetical protein
MLEPGGKRQRSAARSGEFHSYAFGSESLPLTLHGSRPRPLLAAITFALFLIQLIALSDLITM